jgi:hypothetical protein
VTPLERRCRWLLRAYPAWYRRDRAGEMLGTLLEASGPGQSWPSLRDARALVTGGLRVRGWTWSLSMLWVAIGASGAGYAFAMTTQTCSDVCASGVISFFQWNGEPRVIIAVGTLAAAVWMLLAIPVLVAGLARFRRRESRDGNRRYAWIGIWIAGVALMVLTYVAAFRWLDGNGPVVSTEGTTLPSPGPAVGWGELPVCAAWLALGAVMTWILAGPARRWDGPDTSSRPGVTPAAGRPVP